LRLRASLDLDEVVETATLGLDHPAPLAVTP